MFYSDDTISDDTTSGDEVNYDRELRYNTPTSLMNAAINGWHSEVKDILIDASARYIDHHYNNMTALTHAVTHHRILCIRALIRKNAIIHENDIILALQFNNVDILALLINHANLTHMDTADSWLIIAMNAPHDNDRVIKYLIEEEEYAVDYENDEEITPLMSACMGGNEKNMRTLLAYDPIKNPDLVDLVMEYGHRHLCCLLKTTH